MLYFDVNRLEIKQPQQTFNRHPMMGGHTLEDAAQRPDPDRLVIWNNLMMLAPLLRRQAKMRTSLTGLPVAQLAKRLDQFSTGDIARQLHRANTSSLTKCSRITEGVSIFSSK